MLIYLHVIRLYWNWHTCIPYALEHPRNIRVSAWYKSREKGMGEGVSLPLPRYGSLVAIHIAVSAPLSREHGFSSGGSSLPDICDGMCSPKWTVEDVGSTHRADLLKTALLGLCPGRFQGEGWWVSSCLGSGSARLDFKPHRADLVFAARGFGVMNGSDAIYAVPHIPDLVSADPGSIGFVGWPVWPGHGRGHVEQWIRLTMRVRFSYSKRGVWMSLPKKGYVHASLADADSVDADGAGKASGADANSVVPKKGSLSVSIADADPVAAVIAGKPSSLVAVACLPNNDLVWVSVDDADSVAPEIAEKISGEDATKATADVIDPADDFVAFLVDVLASPKFVVFVYKKSGMADNKGTGLQELPALKSMASTGKSERVTDGSESRGEDSVVGVGNGTDGDLYKASTPVTATACGHVSLGHPIQKGWRSPNTISGDVDPVLAITAMVLHFDFGYCSPVSFRLGLPFSMVLWIIPLIYVCGQGLGVMFECLIRSESISAMMDFVLLRGRIMHNMLVGTGFGVRPPEFGPSIFAIWSPMC